MSVRVTHQQDDLKENHARRPDDGGPPKPGQNKFGDHGLNKKQQESADKDC